MHLIDASVLLEVFTHFGDFGPAAALAGERGEVTLPDFSSNK